MDFQLHCFKPAYEYQVNRLLEYYAGYSRMTENTLNEHVIGEHVNLTGLNTQDLLTLYAYLRQHNIPVVD